MRIGDIQRKQVEEWSYRASYTICAPIPTILYKLPLVLAQKIFVSNCWRGDLDGIATPNGDTASTLRGRLNTEFGWLCVELIPIVGPIISQYSNYKHEQQGIKSSNDILRILLGQRLITIMETIHVDLEAAERAWVALQANHPHAA